MPNILHVIDTTGPGGAETIFIQLAHKTALEGYNSIALIRGKGWVHSQLQDLNIPNYIINCKGSLNFKYLLQLIRLIKSQKIDTIQSHLLGSNVYCALAGWLTNTPVIATFHGSVDISSNEKFRTIKLLALRLGCHRIITVTKQLEAIIRSLPILNKNQICTIYNGIDTDAFSAIDATSFRNELNIKQSDLLIGSLGNIRPAKNYPLAIETIRELHKRGVKAHYAIAGQGNESQLSPLVALINQYSLNAYIHLLGFTQNTQAYLSALDMFLMTSSSEGHPLALTQAMANGLPIVTTKSGVEEIVTDKKEALISINHSASELANLIQEATKTTRQNSNIASQAKLKAKKLYNTNTMFASYLKLYELMEKGGQKK